jgi:hypothetical protein
VPTYIRGTDVRINGNTAWHSGNDGAGSGLDADLLDGIQAERFIYGDNARGSVLYSSGDLNDITKSGFYHTSNSVLNQPPGISSGFCLHIQHPSNNVHAIQIFQGGIGNNAQLYVRRKSDTGWGDWGKLWTEFNDGAGSGLDADMLDGIQAERFIYGDNARGTVHYAGDLNNITKSGFYYAFSGHSNGPSGANGFLIHHQMSVDNNFAAQTFIDYNNDRFYFRRKVDGEWQGWKKIWNESNDGPGSGLDADTVDGQHASAFWKKSEIPYETGTWTPELTFGNSSSGITYSNRKGRYTRIRNVVYWTMEMQLTSKGTATGTARISGLPFIPLSNAPDVILPVGYATRITLPSGGAWVSAQIFWNSAALVLFASGNVSTNASITNEHFADNSGLKIQGFYFIPD